MLTTMNCRAARTTTLIGSVAAAFLMAGCYDAAALMTSERAAHEADALEEIDLGKYSIVLAHNDGPKGIRRCEFHVFSLIDSANKTAVEDIASTRQEELQARMLLAVRSLPPDQFKQPRLDQLRQTVVSVVNDAAGAKLIDSVGFYEISLDME